jgi:hypothetical protein
VVIFPSTPGDRRWKHNMRAVLRRHLGVRD